MSVAMVGTVGYDKRVMDRELSQSNEMRLPAKRSQPAIKLWWRGLQLRCPACGVAPIFRGWFSMHEACASCGRRFDRGPGYLLGSIYFNYGVTATLVLVGYFAMFFGDLMHEWQRLVVLSVFAAGFGMWFFRYARALWIAFDERWDPWPNEEELRAMRSEEQGARSEKLA
jgi:uncharacterized protein (DUF983 family)